MSYILSFADRKVAEVAKAESLVKSVEAALAVTHDPEKKLLLMWELGFVHLRSLEDFREPK